MLKQVYPIIFIVSIYFNVKQANILVTKADYVILSETS